MDVRVGGPAAAARRHHQEFDCEPDITGWEGIPRVELCMADYRACDWPAPLTQKDCSVARFMDGMNDTALLEYLELQPHEGCASFCNWAQLLERIGECRSSTLDRHLRSTVRSSSPSRISSHTSSLTRRSGSSSSQISTRRLAATSCKPAWRCDASACGSSSLAARSRSQAARA
eukprot:scaffold1847_cov343-Prasinococcus_capsulatus_cf.AAC.17